MGAKTRAQGRRTVDIPELARALGVSPQTLYQAVRDGKIAAVRLGQRRVVVPVVVAEQLLGEAWHGADGGHRAKP